MFCALWTSFGNQYWGSNTIVCLKSTLTRCPCSCWQWQTESKSCINLLFEWSHICCSHHSSFPEFHCNRLSKESITIRTVDTHIKTLENITLPSFTNHQSLKNAAGCIKRDVNDIILVFLTSCKVRLVEDAARTLTKKSDDAQGGSNCVSMLTDYYIYDARSRRPNAQKKRKGLVNECIDRLTKDLSKTDNYNGPGFL